MSPDTTSYKILHTRCRILQACIIFSSLFGFLKWGGDNAMFLFQMEALLLHRLFTDPASVLHPFTLIPLAGQWMLFINILKPKPSTWLLFLGIASLGLLMALILLIGILELDIPIIASVLPFWLLTFLCIRCYKRLQKLK